MGWPSCDWCGAAADLVDNYDTLRCWECWDDGGRDKHYNLVMQGGSTVGRYPRCGAEAAWVEQSTAPTAEPDQQLALFGERS